MIKRNHIGPDLIYIGTIGIVDHIRGEAAAGTHVDFQSDNVSLFAHSRLVLGQTEEFEMDKTALDAKALDGSASGTAYILRQILYNIIDGIILVVDDIHNGHWCDIARFKHAD